MKRFILFFAFLLSVSTGIFAQETARPLANTEIVRKVSIMDIEGKIYENVLVTMKSTSPDYLIAYNYKVKVTIQDADGKQVWKKTLKNVFLYVFSNGQVQIGKRNFNQLLIQKSYYSDEFIGAIREKEGIY